VGDFESPLVVKLDMLDKFWTMSKMSKLLKKYLWVGQGFPRFSFSVDALDIFIGILVHF
jgi:hypothetical protein